ncbi:MAG: glycosyltransferase family 2 protein [Bdellovibrionales bacterium]|nr:glycosyltransferase family 2 protein [Bdellovibrionales bacterium]
MNNANKISILMGAYNCEHTLAKAIESIINQTYQNWEFIVCDDASRDNTWDIIQRYAKLDPRIIPIQNEKNKGLAATLNECSKYAVGEYIGRQDADDTSVPDRLEKQMNYLLAHPEIDVLSSNAHLCDENGNIWGERISSQNIKKTDWARGSQIIHACVVMKTSILNKANGYDAKALRVEDYDLWMRIIAMGGKIANLPEKLYTIQWSFKDYRRKRRQDRFREIKYKVKGMLLNKMPLWSYIFVMKSLVVILMPNFLLYKYHTIKMNKR